ncbi:MAG: SDR family oxidoreductase, partial [Marinobacter sp.]|nr:SDR family oxidoreductase [Marinobacter sp.]
CCRAVLPYMVDQQGGAIVNVSSVATRGLMRVPYGAAKGGVNAITVNLAFEYAEHGIRVNATAPGGTEAPPRLTPRNTEAQGELEKAWYQTLISQTNATSFMHRYGTLDEQAEPILFLASDAASYMTGTILPVAGGDCG